MTDPIVKEVREARAAIAAEFNYDLHRYLQWIREQTEARKSMPAKSGPNQSLNSKTTPTRLDGPVATP